MNLNDKQKQFCEEYLIDLNATQSAIRAGYSEKTAHSIGSENLMKPEIQNYISILKEKRNKRVQITQDEVLNQLLTWLNSDITETFGLTQSQIKELPIEIRRLITSYKRTVRSIPMGNGKSIEEENVELKFVSKEKAIEMVNKHIGFYEADNKIVLEKRKIGYGKTE